MARKSDVVKIALLTGVVASVATLGGFALWYKAQPANKRRELKRKAEKLSNQITGSFQNLRQEMEEWGEEVEQQVNQSVQAAVERVQEKLADVVPAVSTPVNKLVNKPAPAKRDNVDAFDLSSRQEQIYQLIKRNVQANMNLFADRVEGVTTRTLRRDLTKLEKLGLVEQVGKTKDSYYRLKK